MSRGTQETSGLFRDFAYGAVTLSGRLFQTVLLSLIQTVNEVPTTPRGIATRFGLFPFRSPLLRESLLFSFPPGTEMFHFPGFASSCEDDWALPQSGYPIRRSPDHSLLPAPRGVSPVAASFIASLCQGIHRMPLVAYRFL